MGDLFIVCWYFDWVMMIKNGQGCVVVLFEFVVVIEVDLLMVDVWLGCIVCGDCDLVLFKQFNVYSEWLYCEIMWIGWMLVVEVQLGLFIGIMVIDVFQVGLVLLLVLMIVGEYVKVDVLLVNCELLDLWCNYQWYQLVWVFLMYVMQ